MYLEEMATDLEDQDWLDMENVEQVPHTCDPIGILVWPRARQGIGKTCWARLALLQVNQIALLAFMKECSAG